VRSIGYGRNDVDGSERLLGGREWKDVLNLSSADVLTLPSAEQVEGDSTRDRQATHGSITRKRAGIL
jgi:hypothetical protein